MKGISLARIGAFPIIHQGTPGWWWDWCQFEGINPYHPELMTEAQRLEYEDSAGEPVPCRNPYRTCPCHPLRLGMPLSKDDPWLAFPGATIVEKCIAWMTATFGQKGRRTT